MTSRLDDTITVHSDTGMEGIPVITYQAWSWLWSQPPGVGEHIDLAIMMFGSTVVSVAQSPVPGDSDASTVLGLVRQVLELTKP